MSHSRLRPLAAAAALIAALMTTAGCFGGDSVVEREDRRLNFTVYVTGDSAGPWAARTEGLADGAKLAISSQDGLVGDERAISVAVVPVEQRDGNEVSAAFGAERVVRDSRGLAVLGVYSAADLPLTAPQINAAEIALVQFGSGMTGLTAQERRGEPGRFEPSGERLAIRGVASDSAVGQAIARQGALAGARVVLVGSAADGRDAGEDALRLANQIARAVGGTVAGGASNAARAGNGAKIFVTGSASEEPASDLRAALRDARGPVAIVDAFDRTLPRNLISRRERAAWRVTRRLADTGSDEARRIRARSRSVFGRDHGDSLVAGYLATKRVLAVLGAQPGRTINRFVYAQSLVAPAPQDPVFPVGASGDSQLAGVSVQRVG